VQVSTLAWLDISVESTERSGEKCRTDKTS